MSDKYATNKVLGQEEAAWRKFLKEHADLRNGKILFQGEALLVHD